MASPGQMNHFTSALLKHFSLFSICGAGYSALFIFSMHWYLYEEVSTWYMPVGWVLGLLLIFRYPYWLTVLLGTLVAHFIINALLWQHPLSHMRDYSVYLLTHHSTYYFIPLFIGHYLLRNWHQQGFLNNAKGVMAFFTLMLINQIGNVIQLGDWLLGLAERVDAFEVRMTHFLGGATGIILVTPLMLTLSYIWHNRHKLKADKLPEGTAVWFVIASTIALIYYLYPQTLYMLRALAFLPIIAMAYRYGWIGSVIMTCTINAFLAFTVYGEVATDLLKDTQFYVFVYGMGGLLLGAVISQQQRLNQQLQAKNTELNQLVEHNRILANKVVNVQEQERKTLSQELHDEVGQNITALQNELKVLEHQFPQIKGSATLGLVRGATEQIYQSIYHLLHWLRPRVLDEFGLHKALSGKYFAQRLQQQGIEYRHNLQGPLDKLPGEIAIAVFRIVQEAVSNCIKHANASCLSLELRVRDNQLHLRVTDDGIGFSQSTHQQEKDLGGFGLEGIQDRVAALNGQFDITTTPGVTLKITLPLTQQGAQTQ